MPKTYFDAMAELLTSHERLRVALEYSQSRLESLTTESMQASDITANQKILRRSREALAQIPKGE